MTENTQIAGRGNRPPLYDNKFTRYCPECGHVGAVSPGARDCCPDGSHAMVVPREIAEQAHLGFKIRLRPPGRASDAPKHVVEAIRVVLGINAQRGDDRKNARRLARTQLRVWLSEIGAATPRELYQAAQANRLEQDGK